MGCGLITTLIVVQQLFPVKLKPKKDFCVCSPKIFFNSNFTLLKLDSSCCITIRVWTNYNYKSWLFKWQHEFSWHFSMVKIVSTFFCYWLWVNCDQKSWLFKTKIQLTFFDNKKKKKFFFSTFETRFTLLDYNWTMDWLQLKIWPLIWWLKSNHHFSIVKSFLSLSFHSLNHI